MCGTGRGWGLLEGVISILTVCLVSRTVKTSGRVCVGRPWCRTWTLPRTSQTRHSKVAQNKVRALNHGGNGQMAVLARPD